jgi:hypothetical protein
MRLASTLLVALALALVLVLAPAGVRAGEGHGTRAGPSAPAGSGAAAFERLKALAGAWEGTVATRDGPPAQVRFEVISGGSAVMETLFPGAGNEMRSVYHLDRGALVMTHYCAAGNQPRMRLAKGSTDDLLVFEFTGGTNLDARKDMHIHGGRIRLAGPDRLEAEWDHWKGGKKTGSATFFLARAPGK